MSSLGLLTHQRSGESKVDKLQSKIAQKATESGVQLVRVHDLPLSGGSLLPWQHQWLQTLPHDRTTGNPIAKKNETLKTCESKETKETNEAIQEVLNLSEELTHHKHGDGNLELKIQAKRKQRHEQVIDSMKKEMHSIGQEMEKEVILACKTLNKNLSIFDKDIEQVFAKMRKEEDASMRDFEQVWLDVQSICARKKKLINEFEELSLLRENKRTETISKILCTSATKLYSIAFVLSNDVDRLINEEAMNINMIVLRNKKSYIQLCKSLLSATLEQEKVSLLEWKRITNRWREIVCNVQEQKFRDYMSSDSITDPENVKHLRTELHSKQEMINKYRQDLLHQLSVLKPPRATKSIVYEWKEKYLKLEKQLSELHTRFLLDWQQYHEDVYSDCEREMDKIKEYLVSADVLEPSTSYQFLSDKCVPLFEHHQKQVTEELRALQKSFDSLHSTQQTQFIALFQYAQGSAHIFDTHLSKMNKISRDKDDALTHKRSQHDLENQTMEANLDIVLDRLRQSSSTEELEEYHKQAQSMLEGIKENYFLFHDNMSSLAQSYPTEVNDELTAYDKNLCKYFGVNRTPPPKKKRGKIPKEGKSLSAMTKGSRPGSKLSRTTLAPPTPPIRAPSTPTSVSSSSSQTPLHSVLQEIISTSVGTSFYVYTRADSGVKLETGANVFMTQDEESEIVSQTFVTQYLEIEDSKFIEAKKGLCQCFLNHLEIWKKEKLKQSEEETAGKIEELRTELELRIHLHKPRSSRVKDDIHDIRAVELTGHQDRVIKHVKAVTSTIQEQKAAVQDIWERLNEEYQTFSDDLSNIRSKLSGAVSTSGLRKIHELAQECRKTHTAQLDNILACHRRIVEGALSDLFMANEDYLQSIKLFSEGGNYCQQEVETTTARLEKQTQRITKAQHLVTTELDSIELHVAANKRKQELYMTTFGGMYQHHLTDVTLLENLKRTLTNCQLQIKTEVSASNTQSLEITRNIQLLKDEIPKITQDHTQLFSILPPLFQMLHDRVSYLYCRSCDYQGARVGEEISTRTVPTQGPISAINVTKDILSYTSGKILNDDSDHITSKSTKGSVTEHLKGGRKSVSKCKQQQMDRKCVNYGIGGGDDEKQCFLPKIRAILKDTHKHLYSLVEEYYRLKGSRGVARSDEIPDSFEQLMDTMIDRLQGYRVQSEQYRNKCIDEFHHLLNSLYTISDDLIENVYTEISTSSQLMTDKKMKELTDSFQQEMKELEDRKLSHEGCLRPFLGHPNKKTELMELCDHENKRHLEVVNCIKRHSTKCQESVHSESRIFLSLLLDITHKLLNTLDRLVTNSDIVPPSKTPLSQQEMLRTVVQKHDYGKDNEQNHPPLSTSTTTATSKTNKPSWPGIEDDSLAFGDKQLILKLHEKTVCSKITSAHNTVINIRDTILKDYKNWCTRYLDNLHQSEEEQMTREDKIYQTWTDSVTAIQKLYQ